MDSLIIVLTRKCFPCACSYCNVLKQENGNFWKEIYKDKEYFQKIIFNIIVFTQENNINSIRFFGWEVFLEKQILVDFVFLLRKNWFEGDIWINTNLHLFEKKDIKWLKNDNVKIITSLNWDKTLHCKTRWVKEKDYFKLLEDVKYLLENDIYIQINTVLFPYEEDFILKIKNILKFNFNNINLLPLMYSILLNEKTIDLFEQKIENLLFWIKKNNLNDNFLNFNILDKKEDNFPLVVDDLVIDSNWDIYGSMIILETFIEKIKDLLYLGNIINLKKIEIDKKNITILLLRFFDILNTNLFFSNSVLLSNRFSDLLLKYK